VRPLGARQAERVDLRVVCATHRDLPGMVARGQFRADLWARLSGVVVRLPPLRARREDFGLLLAALLRKLAPDRTEDLALSRDTARALLAHPWPLNVRELENVLRSGLGLLNGHVLDVRPGEPISVPPLPDFDEADDEGDEAEEPETPGEASGSDVSLEGDLDTRRQAQIIALLKAHDGNVLAVARAMRRSRGAIHRWIKKYGIDPERYRK
jgi:DNA-binding NtrC family response regulator